MEMVPCPPEVRQSHPPFYAVFLWAWAPLVGLPREPSALAPSCPVPYNARGTAAPGSSAPPSLVLLSQVTFVMGVRLSLSPSSRGAVGVCCAPRGSDALQPGGKGLVLPQHMTHSVLPCCRCRAVWWPHTQRQ